MAPRKNKVFQTHDSGNGALNSLASLIQCFLPGFNIEENKNRQIYILLML